MPAFRKHTTALLACALIVACTPTAPATPPTNAPAATTQAAVPTQPAPTSAPTTLPAPTDPPAPTQVPATAAPATALPTIVAPPLDRTLSLEQPMLEGGDVLALQQRLLALNYSQLGSADGLFGKNTEQAVRSFQTLNQITIDGIVGPDTWGFLFAADAVRYDLHPIVAMSSGYLLGAANAGAWLDPLRIDTITGVLPYAILQQQGTSVQASGSAPRSSEYGICEDTRYVDLQPELTDDRPVAIANATWNMLPRPISDVPTDTVALQKPVAGALRVLGLSNPVVKITRAQHGDLDGDGTQETIVATFYRVDGSDFPAPSAAAGDYSALFVIPDGSDLASLIDGSVVTKDIEFGAPLLFRLLGVWDLNGDGTMEIVAESSYFEGQSVSIYTLEGTAAKQVLATGCGV